MAITEDVTVNGKLFKHVFTKTNETYTHVGEDGRQWCVGRRLAQSRDDAWDAYVVDGGADINLNSGMVSGGRLEQKDPLYHLDCLNPLSLIEGVVGLIEQGWRPGASEAA